MLEAEIWSVARIDQGNAVLLRPLGSDTVVPIFIGDIEAHAILLGLGEAKVKRPLTCDLLLELSRRLGFSLFRVEVYEIREDIFYARLFFSGGDYAESRPLVIESRPSDAIALAAREKCGVYVAARVLEQAGIPADIFIDEAADAASTAGITGNGIDEEDENDETEDDALSGSSSYREAAREISRGSKGAKTPGSPLAAKRRRLQAELERAVEGEAYERAAEIRDLLILLDRQLEQEGRKTP
jgi:bifunctional DNase/RNase